jgi:hypothetical protein
VADDALMAELRVQLNLLGRVLTQRAGKARVLEMYGLGDCPLPAAITQSKLTKAYKALMPMSTAPWGGLVVDSVLDRLEVSGIRDDDDAAAKTGWGIWQDNFMDSESKLGHASALTNGRAFAIVWPDDDGDPEITLESAEQMIVQYREGSRRHRLAALRQWVDPDGMQFATLYRPDGVYKFQRKGKLQDPALQATNNPVLPDAEAAWDVREVPGESWPLENPFGEVPVVELAVNRRLRPGSFGYARGEFENCTGLIDRVNLLTFLGLVVAFWMGFPLRGVIGDKILRDDDGKMLPPFNVHADEVFQLENPEAKLAEFKAADRGNLSIFDELAQLAYLTKTPAHYFPMSTGLSNISADAIRALEGGMHAKVIDHKASLSEGWEEVLRLGGKVLNVEMSARAELQWKDSESRSLAERADAASKLKDILPPMAIAELVLNITQSQWSRWQSMATSDAFAKLLVDTANPPAVPAPA